MCFFHVLLLTDLKLRFSSWQNAITANCYWGLIVPEAQKHFINSSIAGGLDEGVLPIISWKNQCFGLLCHHEVIFFFLFRNWRIYYFVKRALVYEFQKLAWFMISQDMYKIKMLFPIKWQFKKFFEGRKFPLKQIRKYIQAQETAKLWISLSKSHSIPNSHLKTNIIYF